MHVLYFQPSWNRGIKRTGHQAHRGCELGRIRYAEKNAPRTIDIDIVLFDKHPLNKDFWEYAFVIVPLAELIPDFERRIRHEKLSRVAEQLQGQVWIALRLLQSLAYRVRDPSLFSG